MKKILQAAVLTAVVIGLTISGSLAQIDSGKRTMGSQMTNQDMARTMAGIMRQMNELMQKMSYTLEHHKNLDSAKTQEMSRMMNDMSVTMKEMSGQISRGKMDSATMKKMQERMQVMNEMLDKIEREGK